jgi:hypothetical protein
MVLPFGVLVRRHWVVFRDVLCCCESRLLRVVIWGWNWIFEGACGWLVSWFGEGELTRLSCPNMTTGLGCARENQILRVLSFARVARSPRQPLECFGGSQKKEDGCSLQHSFASLRTSRRLTDGGFGPVEFVVGKLAESGEAFV